MKKIFLILLLSCLRLATNAQDYDIHIANLINNRDLFNLVNEKSKLDDMHYQGIKYLSKALIGFYTNNPNESNDNIKILLTDYQNEIDPETTINAVLIMGINYMRLKQYDSADMILKQIYPVLNTSL